MRPALLSVLLMGLILGPGLSLCQQSAVRGEPAPWPRATPGEAGLDEAKLIQARDYSLHGGGSGMIIYRGKLVFSWGDLAVKYDLKSTTKSFGATVLGLAMQDGKVKLDDPVMKHLPEFGYPPETNRATGWLKEITLWHLATQTAGFDKQGGYQPLLFKPGTQWAYSDSGPNWLADSLTMVYRRDLRELMNERVFAPLGISRDDLSWRENAYRPSALNGIARREFGSGIHANVDAMARFGLLYLRAGRIGGRQILPPDFVAAARVPSPGVQGLRVTKPVEYPRASSHYGYLWWNNADGWIERAPRDAYWSWGLFDNLIIVIPSLDMVIVRAGRKAMDDSTGAVPGRLKPLLEPIVEAASPRQGLARPPYPPSGVIESAIWAPPSTIRRSGSDCDNLPTTWADDNELYTAYGDCRGFDPVRPAKLGMGFGRISGAPPALKEINIPAPSGENNGQGRLGRKGSGLLMVDGVLYLWARNAGNSQLAWSTDHAKTWTWSDWKFTTSFGHPAFLNFGKNYAGARDQYVYIYSPDSDSAYEASGRVVMARVPKDRLRDRGSYSFFQRIEDGGPVWTSKIEDRGAVFSNPPAGCYRTQVSYNAGLRRYFMNQVHKGETDVRFQGGFGVYDAPEPWGPWTTVYFTPTWDAGPGENQHFPPKWMSSDGKTMFLVFSGDDRFSLRKVTLSLHPRLTQHRVTSRPSPAPEPGAERELIPSLVEGLRSPADWYGKRRPEIVKLWTQILGKLGPDRNDRRWFGDIRKAVILETQETEKYTRIRLDLPMETDFQQKHLLLLPKNQGPGPFPAVVCWSSSTPDFAKPEEWWGKWLAENGYVVLTSWSFIRHYRGGTSDLNNVSERLYERFGHWLPMAKMVHDAQREAEYLRGLKQVDGNRIGFIGFSLGAKAAVYVAAFAKEFKATVALDPHIAINGGTNWYAPWYLDWRRPFPGIRTAQYTVLSLLNPDVNRAGFEHDHHELMALTAPRAFLLIGGKRRCEDCGGDSDDLQSWGYFNRAREVYQLLGIPERIEFALTDDGHKPNGPEIDPAWKAFFERWLKQGGSRMVSKGIR
ncbi:MAG: serine hydrolase [Acidobacteria bacterium]|nr:serine hydrolase [Acidobacteriota bacterium]